jgi:hypothetical protein
MQLIGWLRCLSFLPYERSHENHELDYVEEHPWERANARRPGVRDLPLKRALSIILEPESRRLTAGPTRCVAASQCVPLSQQAADLLRRLLLPQPLRAIFCSRAHGAHARQTQRVGSRTRCLRIMFRALSRAVCIGSISR